MIISSYFADIFKGNALNNGLLPIQIEKAKLEQLLTHIAEHPKAELLIDLEKQKLGVEAIGLDESFAIDGYKKMCLINGYDDIDFLISKKAQIDAFAQINA